MIEFQKEYLQIINQSKETDNIISEGILDSIKKIFSFDKFQATCQGMNNVNLENISNSNDPKSELSKSAESFTEALPFMKHVNEKLNKAGETIGNKIKQNSEKVLAQGQQVEKTVDGQSERIQAGSKIAINKGVTQTYDQYLYKHTQRKLVLQDIQYPKTDYKKLDKQFVNMYKDIVEECAKRGKFPAHLISTKYTQQKPIIFENYTYTFENKNNKIICQKTYTKSNKKIIYENYGKQTKILTIQNNNIISQNIIKIDNILIEGQSIIYEQQQYIQLDPKTQEAANKYINKTKIGSAGADKLKNVTWLKQFFLKLKRIIQKIVYVLVFSLLWVLKAIADLIGKLKGKYTAWIGAFGNWLSGLIKSPRKMAARVAKSAVGTGFSIFITVALLIGLVIIIISLFSNLFSSDQKQQPSKIDPNDLDLSLIQDFQV